MQDQTSHNCNPNLYKNVYLKPEGPQSNPQKDKQLQHTNNQAVAVSLDWDRP